MAPKQKNSYHKVRQPKLSDVIVTELETMILEGTLQPGEKLPPERELAKQFDVSRPSLREAIQKLEARGLVSRRQGGGTYVQDHSWQQMADPLTELLMASEESQLDLLEFRLALEGISAFYAAMRGTETDFEQIQECLRQIETAQDGQDLKAEVDAVLALCIKVTEASHNLVMLQVVLALKPLLHSNIEQNLSALQQRSEAAEKLRQHRRHVVEMILQRQSSQARAATLNHLAYIEETLLDLRQEDDRKQRSLRRTQRPIEAGH